MILHLAYFEVLAETEENAPAWAEVSAGLLFLRAVDSWIESGSLYAPGWSKIGDVIASIDDASPVRPPLQAAFDCLAAQTSVGVRPLVPSLVAYGRALERQSRWSLAKDVYESILGHQDPDDDDDAFLAVDDRLAVCEEHVVDTGSQYEADAGVDRPPFAPPEGMHQYRLTEVEERQVMGVVMGLAMANAELDLVAQGKSHLDRVEPVDELIQSLRPVRGELTRLIARAAFDNDPAFFHETAIAAIGETLRDALTRFQSTLTRMGPLPTLPDRMQGEFDAFGLCLREHSLEEYGVVMVLGGRDEDEWLEIVWEAASPHAAFVDLYEPLLARLEEFAGAIAMVALERYASRWMFCRFGAMYRTDREMLPVRIREQEWSLLDRPTLALGKSIIEAFCDDPEFASRGARMQQLARAARDASPGIFIVRETFADGALLEHVLDGRRYRILEHSEEADYRVGTLAYGRVFAFDGEYSVRSPGMMLYEGDREGLLANAKDLLERWPKVREISYAIDTLLSTQAPRDEQPQDEPAAESLQMGEAMLTMLRTALVLIGRGREMDPTELEPTIPARADGATYWDFDVDETVQQWMHALEAFIEAGGGAAE